MHTCHLSFIDQVCSEDQDLCSLGLFEGETLRAATTVKAHVPRGLEVMTLAVPRTERHRGWGRLLVEAILEHARAQVLPMCCLPLWASLSFCGPFGLPLPGLRSGVAVRPTDGRGLLAEDGVYGLRAAQVDQRGNHATQDSLPDSDALHTQRHHLG